MASCCLYLSLQGYNSMRSNEGQTMNQITDYLSCFESIVKSRPQVTTCVYVYGEGGSIYAVPLDHTLLAA